MIDRDIEAAIGLGVEETIETVGRHGEMTRLQNDLGADALIREEFKHERMRDASINEMHLPNAAVQAIQRAIHLGNHAAADDAFVLQSQDVGFRQLQLDLGDPPQV